MKLHEPHGRLPLRRVFAVPAALAAASLGGLVIALAGDGVSDAIGWACLAAPVGAVIWALRNRRI